MTGLAIAEWSYKASFEAAENGKKVIRKDDNGNKVVAIPKGVDKEDPNCKVVVRTLYSNGQKVSESRDKICTEARKTNAISN